MSVTKIKKGGVYMHKSDHIKVSQNSFTLRFISASDKSMTTVEKHWLSTAPKLPLPSLPGGAITWSRGCGRVSTVTSHEWLPAHSAKPRCEREGNLHKFQQERWAWKGKAQWSNHLQFEQQFQQDGHTNEWRTSKGTEGEDANFGTFEKKWHKPHKVSLNNIRFLIMLVLCI